MPCHVQTLSDHTHTHPSIYFPLCFHDACSITRCSVERVVSGLGIPRIYEFLCKRNPKQVNPAVQEALAYVPSLSPSLALVWSWDHLSLDT